DGCPGKPIASFNLLGMQSERTLGCAAVDPDMFLISLGRGRKLEQPLWRIGQFQTDFLAQLANGTNVVFFPGIQITRCRGVPETWLAVLAHGTFLEKHLASSIEHQDVHRSMHKPKSMDLTTRSMVHDFVAFIDNVKDFFAHAGIELMRQIDPG